MIGPIKKYIEHLNFSNQDYEIEFKFINILHSIKKAVEDQIEYYCSIDKPDIPSLFAASAAYFRLKNTFKAVILCIRSDLYLETLALIRMIIEQLAWIYKVHDYQGDFFKILPTKCINSLRNIFPHINEIYGKLSARTHINPENTIEYLTIYENNLGIRIKDKKQSNNNTKILLHVYDYFCIIGEYIVRSYTNNYIYLKKDENDNYKINTSRPSNDFIKRHKDELDEIEKYLLEKIEKKPKVSP